MYNNMIILEDIPEGKKKKTKTKNTNLLSLTPKGTPGGL